jgi:hypothetical protein
MTLNFNESNNILKLYWNYPNLTGVGTLEFISLHSNLPLQLNLTDLTVSGNSRYSTSQFTVDASEISKEHFNGIYKAVLSIGDTNYTQAVKIILTPGGDTGTVPYISNNEDREAVVYYKPEY